MFWLLKHNLENKGVAVFNLTGIGYSVLEVKAFENVNGSSLYYQGETAWRWPAMLMQAADDILGWKLCYL